MISEHYKRIKGNVEGNVTESFLPDDSENAVEEFLRLVRKRMLAEQIATKKDR